MRPLPTVAGQQFGAFTAAQARHDGWTSHALRHAVGVGALERLRPGVYALPSERDTVGQRVARLRTGAAAVSLTNRRLTTCSSAAAALHGIELLDVPDDVCAVYARGHRGSMPSVHRHRGTLSPGHVQALGRVLLTSPARTVVDLAREHGADAGIVAADSAVRAGLVTDVELRAVLARCAGWPGLRGARRAVDLADPRSESALESISRLRMVDAGLPAPRPQTDILTSGGRFLGRVDFYWDEFGVAGEVDGLAKYDDPGDGVHNPLRAEKLRQESLERCGLIVVRWGWRDLWSFAATAARIRSALTRGCATNRPAREWIPAWPQARAADPAS